MLLFNKLKGYFSNPFIQNIGWLTGAELFNRVLRLGVVVVLARLLSPYDYGLVAIILTINEFSNILTLRAGIGSKLIQVSEQELGSLCETAYWINWLLGITLFALQCVLAFPIALVYGNQQIVLPICVTGLVYLIFPIFSVQSALIYRSERMNIIALCNIWHSIGGNLLTILFAFLGMGMWSVVLPITIAPAFWLIIILKHESWRPKSSFTLHRWEEIFEYSVGILGIELLNRLRANLDYLLIGKFLGIDALGLYYFAFNAGLGISLNLLNAVSSSIFPHLCEVRDNLETLRKRYFSSLKKIAIFIIPFVLLQTALAPFYVPIVYGTKWIAAIPILMIVCLSALPRPFADSASKLLQAIDQVKIDLYWNFVFTIAFSISILIALYWGIFGVAIAVLISHVVALPLLTLWTNRYVFANKI